MINSVDVPMGDIFQPDILFLGNITALTNLPTTHYPSKNGWRLTSD
ncbi:MAG: hypothetical protein ACR5LF_06980 [Symbiopectobacterium sp.]